MGFIEGLFEWALGFAGIIGVFILLLFLGAGVFFVGTFMILVPGVLIEVFTRDEDFKLIRWRAVLVIGVVIGLSYCPALLALRPTIQSLSTGILDRNVRVAVIPSAS